MTGRQRPSGFRVIAAAVTEPGWSVGTSARREYDAHVGSGGRDLADASFG